MKENHYPFGMLQPGRNYNAPGAVDYRYGFNGKENDDEAKGEGNQQDYGMRIYDPRVGRFLSVDPLTKDFPMLTPYQFASNSPIANIDLDGLESVAVNPKTGEVIMGPLDISTLRAQGWKTKMLPNYKPSPSLFQPQTAKKPQLQVAIESTGQQRSSREMALRRDAPSPLPKRQETMDEAPHKTKTQIRNEEFQTALSSARIEKERAIEKDHRLSDDFPIIGGFVKAGRQAMKGNYFDAAQSATAAGVETLLTIESGGTLKGFKTLGELGLKDGMEISSAKALDAAEQFLGKGYTEPIKGSGRFVSADGTRVFRMGENDILGKHGGGPHVNFETLKPNPAKPGKMEVDQNIHIYIKD